jgi:hypothetical protein
MPSVDILHSPRGEGKTTELINRAADTGYYIVAPTHEDCYRIHQQSIRDGTPVHFPMTWHEWVGNQYNPYGVRGLYVDDIDRCLAMHSRVSIHLVTGRFEPDT